MGAAAALGRATSSRRCIIIAVLAVVVTISLAVGLGVGLSGSGGSSDSSSTDAGGGGGGGGGEVAPATATLSGSVPAQCVELASGAPLPFLLPLLLPATLALPQLLPRHQSPLAASQTCTATPSTPPALTLALPHSLSLTPHPGSQPTTGGC